jgi:NAD(P)-dependent dehydrogenase (short-subunit alcohol dehydrogenase family)
MGKLKGKVALVTGSGRNIGRATVLKLAGEGANIVVNARSNEQEANSVVREAEDLGVKAISVIADVGKRDQVEAMAQKALGEFGRVDILINNAAIRPHKPFLEVSDQDWERVRNVVLDGAFYLTRALNAAGIPLGRQGHVDEIAATCLFLVGEDGGFITGQTIHVNGGAAYY